jgi:hypothetical protein
MVIAFTMKTNYQYIDCSITHTGTIRDIGLNLDTKLHFHAIAGYIFFQSVRLLGLIRTITYSFSAFDSSLILYWNLVTPKLECSSGVWNSVPSADAKVPYRIQRKFVALSQYRYFIHEYVTYEDFRAFYSFLPCGTEVFILRYSFLFLFIPI